MFISTGVSSRHKALFGLLPLQTVIVLVMCQNKVVFMSLGRQ